MDFTQEADECFRLAESEVQPEIKMILTGMAYGWLTIADHHKTLGEGRIHEPTEEPIDDLV